MNIQPYSISIPDADLADLRDRLARTRWPDDLVSDWSRGVPVSYARKLVERWRDFDWRAQEARLNRYPQVIAEVDGQPIHVVHVTSAAPDAVPLLLCHGYPTSFVEFTALIDALVEPTEGGPAFHVVIPSIPGLGFSTPLTSTGWDIPRIAGAYDQIMQALGYERYAVFGGDVGAGILEELCIEAGERVISALISTDAGAIATEYTPSADHLTAEEKQHHADLKAARREDFGYIAVQATRPLSIAYGLTDSPVAQLSWIVEKFGEWTDPDAALPEDAVDIDQLLTLVSVYWFGRGGAGAANLLYETAHSAAAWGRSHDRPKGFTAYGDEPLMRRILDPDETVPYWSGHVHGGHFPAMEVPDEVVADIRAFFARVPA